MWDKPTRRSRKPRKSKQPSQEAREECLKRDDWRCVRCGAPLNGNAFSLHHRRMRSHPFAGLHKPSNLICLCGSGTTGCHGWVHANPKLAYEHGYLVHAWDDPRRVPVDHQKWGKVYLWSEGCVMCIPEP